VHFPIISILDITDMTPATHSARRARATAMAAIFCSTALLHAGQLGVLTYEIVGGTEIEITDCAEDATGPVGIPEQIEGKPVTSIGSSAFRNVGEVTIISIPASVNQIDGYVFTHCPKLTAFFVNTGNTAFSSADGVLFDKAQSHLVRYPEGKAGAYVVPTGVATIAQAAFSDCNKLTSATIPASVAEIPSAAFWDCDTLTSVVLSEGLSKIGDRAFRFCTMLPEIILPSTLATIGRDAFRNCIALTDITIPAGVTDIGESTFAACSALQSISVENGGTHYRSVGGVLFNADQSILVQFPAGRSGEYTVPPGVADLGDGAFSGCESLTGVDLPAGLSRISDSAFFYCESLARIEIPDSVLSIEDWAFFRCSSLTSVVIPANVADIQLSAFGNCSSLGAATFLGNAPTMGSRVFESAKHGFAVYFFNGATGFATPEWNGYPTVEIDEALHPAARWLAGHGLRPDTPLDEDANGDGVDLHIAWALNLDPNENLAGSMPQAVLAPGALSITHYAANPAVTYIVETSTDLANWTDSGVNLSGPADNRTATVPRDAPRRFLRLRVE